MRRGDIYFANLEPVQGSEANKVRPVVIVSNDALNTAVESLLRGVVTVVPLTKNVEQVRALALQRFVPNLKGSLSKSYLLELDRALKLHFDL